MDTIPLANRHMTIAFISDLHLTPDRPESSIMFEQFLKTTGSVVKQLYILGDLFEYWIGDDAGDQLGHEQIERAIKNVTQAGTDVYFIHGNRDFLIGTDFAKRTGSQILPDPYLIELGGKRIVLSHGDALCTDDIEHQESRKTMLSSKWKMSFLEQSIDQRMGIAAEMRDRSEKGKKIKDMTIMDVNQQSVEALMETHCADILIHGHTHRPGIHEFTIDSKKMTRYVLGDWYEQKSFLTYENETFLLKA